METPTGLTPPEPQKAGETKLPSKKKESKKTQIAREFGHIFKYFKTGFGRFFILFVKKAPKKEEIAFSNTSAQFIVKEKTVTLLKGETPEVTLLKGETPEVTWVKAETPKSINPKLWKDAKKSEDEFSKVFEASSTQAPADLELEKLIEEHPIIDVDEMEKSSKQPKNNHLLEGNPFLKTIKQLEIDQNNELKLKYDKKDDTIVIASRKSKQFSSKTGTGSEAKQSVERLFKWAHSAIDEAEKNKTEDRDYEKLREVFDVIEKNQWIKKVLKHNKTLKEDFENIKNTITELFLPTESAEKQIESSKEDEEYMEKFFESD